MYTRQKVRARRAHVRAVSLTGSLAELSNRDGCHTAHVSCIRQPHLFRPRHPCVGRKAKEYFQKEKADPKVKLRK